MFFTFFCLFYVSIKGLSAACKPHLPFFCPETKEPKILRSKGEMARHQSWQKQKSQRVCADLSPSPRWLTFHIGKVQNGIEFDRPALWRSNGACYATPWVCFYQTSPVVLLSGFPDWRSNGASLGHLIFRFNVEIQSRIIFSLLTFSFYQRESK